MAGVLDDIAAKKVRLDALRPLAPELRARLEAWYEVELAYASNALEGNILTRQETAQILEKGITVRGKPLRDHMEALDHRDAWTLVRTLADGAEPIREIDLRSIHALVVGRTDKDAAGRYAEQPRFVAGSRAVFPSPAELPALMGDFAAWLVAAPPTPENASEAHLRLVSIHPFADGNGRTARLLMNLLLVRGGYPAAAIDPARCADYLDALEAAQADDDRARYDAFMLARIDEALDAYLGLIEGRQPARPA